MLKNGKIGDKVYDKEYLKNRSRIGTIVAFGLARTTYHVAFGELEQYFYYDHELDLVVDPNTIMKQLL